MSRPLRVAVMADTLPPRGYTGGGMAHFHLAAALRQEGIEVRTFTFLELPRLWKYAVKALLRSMLWFLAFVRRPLRRPGLRLELDTAALGALGGWAKFGEIRAWQPDFVIVPDYGACASFWPVAWRRRLVLVAHSGPLRFLGLSNIGLRDAWDARLAWHLETRMSREAAASVVPSTYMKRVYERDYPHRGRATVIANLLNEPALEGIKAERPALGDIDYWIFLPSPGNRNKGRAVLVELLSRLAGLLAPKSVAFILSGELDAGLRRRLGGLPKNAAYYAPGPVAYEKNMALMKGCQICVSPTFIESFGMALLEAQFCGLPVVCFDVDATAEVVAQGKTGCLVSGQDTGVLAKAAADLLKDPRRLARWSRAAMSTAQYRFSARRSGKAFAKLLSGLARP